MSSITKQVTEYEKTKTINNTYRNYEVWKYELKTTKTCARYAFKMFYFTYKQLFLVPI